MNVNHSRATASELGEENISVLCDNGRISHILGEPLACIDPIWIGTRRKQHCLRGRTWDAPRAPKIGSL